MRTVPGIVLAVFAVTLTACSGGSSTTAETSGATSAPPSQTTAATGTQPDCTAGFLAQYTTRQKLAQLLTVGVNGLADAEALVRTEQIGGVFLGSWTDQALLSEKQIDRVEAAARTP